MNQTISRKELHETTMLMVLARLQAEGKIAAEMSGEELQPYIDDAVSDLSFAIDVTGTAIEPR